MFALPKLEVLRRVVLPVAVDVVHGFMFFEGAAELVGHDEPVLEDIVRPVRLLLSHGEEGIIFPYEGHNVPLRRHQAPAFPAVMVRPALKAGGTKRNPGRP